MNRVALTNTPMVKGLLRSRWPQFFLRASHIRDIFAGYPGRDTWNTGGQPQYRHCPCVDCLVGFAGIAGRSPIRTRLVQYLPHTHARRVASAGLPAWATG